MLFIYYIIWYLFKLFKILSGLLVTFSFILHKSCGRYIFLLHRRTEQCYEFQQKESILDLHVVPLVSAFAFLVTIRRQNRVKVSQDLLFSGKLSHWTFSGHGLFFNWCPWALEAISSSWSSLKIPKFYWLLSDRGHVVYDDVTKAFERFVLFCQKVIACGFLRVVCAICFLGVFHLRVGAAACNVWIKKGSYGFVEVVLCAPVCLWRIALNWVAISSCHEWWMI